MIASAPGRRRRILAIAILASFVLFFDGSVVNLALPAIARNLGGGLTLQQWVVGCFQLAAVGALLLLAGSVSGAIGRIAVLRFALLAFGAGSVLAAAAPSGGVLMAARAVQGLGAAFLVPSSLALINSTFDSGEQPRAVGVWTAWTGTAYVLGPLAGGLIVDMLNWRWVFLLTAVPMIVTFFLSLGLTSANTRPVGVDYVGGALGATGLTGTVFALIEVPRLGLSHPAVAVALAVGLICIAAFVWWQLIAPNPTVPLHLFAIRNFGIGNLVAVFYFGGVSMGTVGVVLFLQEVAGFTALQAGIAILPWAVLSFLLATRIGALSARTGPRIFVAAGPLTAALGFAVMRPDPAGFDFWSQLLPGLTLFGLGATITATPLTATLLAAVTSTHGGIGSAVNNTVSRIAGLLAIALIGVIATGAMDYLSFRRLALVTAALMTASGAVAAVGIRNQVEPQIITRYRGSDPRS